MMCSRLMEPSVVLRVRVGGQRLQDARDDQQGRPELQKDELRKEKMSKSFSRRRFGAEGLLVSFLAFFCVFLCSGGCCFVPLG